ncbi:hypothetical protein [Ureibacillus aquaedulcis]|uniref:Uncharacterized protein n=1 Tax=Ureibacillus aquaedulcis TaxID=3058421 RepID=A0ABT8GMB2_9BACL|nr:hypothetical protein [Ureibacillus sp. BA0131]MDN4492546.1 hypothetical protein [Ureibacillus sp. BA0131]
MKFENAVLEYRLHKATNLYEPIYYYKMIELSQILARRECEFFIKEGKTYKQLSSSIEGNLFVIYVELFEEGPIELENTLEQGIKLEVRELNARQNYPLLSTEDVSNHLDILSVIGSVYTYLEKNEWERDSAEIDEDRGVYVLYVTPTGYTLET